MTITTMEVAGLRHTAPASRLSHRSNGDGLGALDMALLGKLANAGDEHAK